MYAVMPHTHIHTQDQQIRRQSSCPSYIFYKMHNLQININLCTICLILTIIFFWICEVCPFNATVL